MSRAPSVLVVDDDFALVEWLAEALRDEGLEVSTASSGSEALTAIERRAFDVVVSDVEMPEMRGLDLVGAVHARRPTQLVVLMTAFGSIDLAMQAIRAGAADFVTKPFPIEALVHAIDRALRERRMKRAIVRLRSRFTSEETHGVVARSVPMRRALDVAVRAARSDATVLITGESGVGKGALARVVHERSERRRSAFVHLNCAALPPNLVEAELFGVRKGAFTDATEDRAGLFVEADGGTLFLDEVAEMSLDVQPKLLHVLETGRVRPVGGGRESKADVRLVAATNQPLEELLRDRRFRPDLYHRLNVVRIDVPPLRERREDIGPLVEQLLPRATKRLGRDVLGVTDEALRWLAAQEWPGNVRELANALERAVALGEHDMLVLEDFLDSHVSDRPPAIVEGALAEGLSLDALEREYIRRVLRRTRGNKSEAARILGIDRRTLYRKVVEMGLEDASE